MPFLPSDDGEDTDRRTAENREKKPRCGNLWEDDDGDERENDSKRNSTHQCRCNHCEQEKEERCTHPNGQSSIGEPSHIQTYFRKNKNMMTIISLPVRRGLRTTET